MKRRGRRAVAIVMAVSGLFLFLAVLAGLRRMPAGTLWVILNGLFQSR